MDLNSLEKSGASGFKLLSLKQTLLWAQKHSMSYLLMDLACCGVEIAHTEGSRYDLDRFGATPEVSPEHADLLLVAGTITQKASPHLLSAYERMRHPKYVIAVGSCAIGGGMFGSEFSYSTVDGLSKLIPVDVFVPGCPPRPEAILQGILELQRKITEKDEGISEVQV